MLWLVEGCVPTPPHPHLPSRQVHKEILHLIQPRGPLARGRTVPWGAGRRGTDPGGCWEAYGLSATGQGAGWVFSVGAVPPLPLCTWGWTLGWIWGRALGWIWGWLPSGKHGQVFSPRLLCRVWRQAWIKSQGLASLPAIQGAGEEPAPPRGPETSIHPLGCASRTHWIRPGWPSPSLLAPAEAGAALAAGSASLSTLCSLQSCLALAPSPTRTHLSTGVMLGGSGHASTKNGFDSKVGDSRASTEHPGLPAGEAGECQLCDCSDPPFAEWQVPHYSA